MLMRTRAVAAFACLAALVLVGGCTSSSPEPETDPTAVQTSEDEDEAFPAATSTATVLPPPLTPDALTADEILTQALDALHVASSYRVTGTIDDGSGAITLDLVYTGDRRGGTWSHGGSVVEIIRIGAQTFVKTGTAFWQELLDEAAAADLDGKWVELDGVYAVLGATFIPDVETLLAPAGVLEKGEQTTVNGTPVVTLTDGNTVVSIATDGPPYPVHVAAEGGTALELSDFGTPATVEAPSGEVVALSTLAG